MPTPLSTLSEFREVQQEPAVSDEEVARQLMQELNCSPAEQEALWQQCKASQPLARAQQQPQAQASADSQAAYDAWEAAEAAKAVQLVEEALLKERQQTAEQQQMMQHPQQFQPQRHQNRWHQAQRGGAPKVSAQAARIKAAEEREAERRRLSSIQLRQAQDAQRRAANAKELQCRDAEERANMAQAARAAALVRYCRLQAFCLRRGRQSAGCIASTGARHAHMHRLWWSAEAGQRQRTVLPVTAALLWSQMQTCSRALFTQFALISGFLQR